MSSFNIFNIAGSGMSAQSVRLNTTASNLANADSVSGDPNQVYKAKHPLFEAIRNGLGANASSSACRRQRHLREPGSAERPLRAGQPARRRQWTTCTPLNVIHGRRNDRHDLRRRRSYQNNVEVMEYRQRMMLASAAARLVIDS